MDLSRDERKTLVYYQMLCNAFREPDDYEPAAEKLELKEFEFSEDIAAMASAIMLFCDRISKGKFAVDDLLEMTYIINRAVVEETLKTNHDANKDEEK